MQKFSYDPMLSGSVCGLISSCIQMILEFVLLWSGAVHHITIDYVGILITPNTFGDTYRIILSICTFIISSSMFGAVFSLLRILIGGQYWVVKGAGVGAMLFVVHDSMIPKLWEPRLFAIISEPNYMVMDLGTHIIWGAATAFLIAKFDAAASKNHA